MTHVAGRIRTLKPEWLENERLASVSDAARLLSVALIVLADDHGRGRGSVPFIAAQVWTYAEDARERAESALRELESISYIRRYSVDGQAYYELPGWERHQKVDKPGKPRVPDPSLATASPLFANVRETLAPDHDHYHDLDHDPPATPEPSREEPARDDPVRKTQDPSGERLADHLRDHLLRCQPGHQLANKAQWQKRRPAWARALGAIAKARGEPQAIALLEWVFGEQGGADPEYRFRVDSPKALGEKWDRIEARMRAPPRGSGRRAPAQPELDEVWGRTAAATKETR